MLLIVANFCFDLLVLHVIDVFHCFVGEIGEALRPFGAALTFGQHVFAPMGLRSLPWGLREYKNEF